MPELNNVPEKGPPYRRSVRDYQFGTRIGEGSYSTVYLAVDLYNKQTYAVKVLSKKHIVRENKIKYVNIEKTALHRLGQQHPGIVQLYYTFQDELKLYFVLDFAEYGELLSIISKFGSLLESVLKFYMLQILDSVKFIHLKGIIHRDLKPENILVGYDFNLKITDFGTAKLLGSDEEDPQERINYDHVTGESQQNPERKGSFVGTAEYVPPELLKYNACGFETDIWAIACILYQFFNGQPPFKGATEYLTFEKIIHIDYVYKRALPPKVKEIIDKVLVFNPQERPKILDIQAMPWFNGIDWENREYLWSRSAPRFEPFNSSGSGGVAQLYPLPPPQLKTGANRNVNKSNSNYKLHSQILRSENLFPVIGAKKTYQPVTRVHQIPPSPGTPKSQIGFPREMPPTTPDAYRVTPSSYTGDASINYGQSPMRLPRIQASPVKLQNPPCDYVSYHNNNVNNNGDQYTSGTYNHLSAPAQINYSPKSSRPGSALQAAQQASQATMPQLESQFADTTLGGVSSPERRNLRQNTAFASLSRQPPNSVTPGGTDQSTSKLVTGPPLEVTQKLKKSQFQSTVITLKEVTNFFEADEKIVKLDSILKARVSNRDYRDKTGNLDNDCIERIIDKQFQLEDKMDPVVACITNRARLFLIDKNLDVLLIDLTANKGHDYLMYDYEFESVMVDSDESDAQDGEEVYGYLILELIKDDGDLVFLKRFSDETPEAIRRSVRVVGANGDTLQIGVELGWIDCLIRMKQIMDNDRLSQKPTLTPTSSRKSSQGTSKNNTRSSVLDKKGPGEEKRLNNFALAAAAAAAHR